jgi:hypothetical protein
MEDGAEVEDRLGGVGLGVHFFFDESYFQSYPLQSCLNRGVIFFGGGGRFLQRFKVELEKVGLGVILRSFLVILPPILPRILPQSYLKSC